MNDSLRLCNNVTDARLMDMQWLTAGIWLKERESYHGCVRDLIDLDRCYCYA